MVADRVAGAAASLPNQAFVQRLFPTDGPNASAELPGVPWYRLEIYSAMPTWSDLDWCAAIVARHSCRTRLESSGADQLHSPPIGRVARYFLALPANPISVWGRRQAHSTDDFLAAYGIGARPPVFELPDAEEVAEEANEMQWRGGDWRVLRVNMLVGDQALEDAFAEWLKASRRDRDTGRLQPLRSAMTTDNRESWARCQVIPYIDIQHFARAAGLKLRPSHIQRALFPPPHPAPKKTFEEATRPFAERLMNRDFRDRLEAQFGVGPR